MDGQNTTAWWARGLLFENCNCQLICPGHMHFDQVCTHDRCLGYWAIRVDEGSYGDVALAGVKALVAFDSPPHMIDGGWTEIILIDESASPEQRQAMDSILHGRVGGPWEKLASFVERWLETRYVPIDFSDEGATKRAHIAGLFETEVTQIRGRDRSKPVLFENIFNQIHAPTQVIATGRTEYNDGVIRIQTEKSHGLFSNFDWAVDPGVTKPDGKKR
jgi:hypothetical protein